jgi:hypothetical protein
MYTSMLRTVPSRVASAEQVQASRCGADKGLEVARTRPWRLDPTFVDTLVMSPGITV